MPNCPNCGHRLAYMEDGSICPNCKCEFTIQQTISIPGYDVLDALIDAQIFRELARLGLLQPGVTQVDIVNGGLIVTFLDEPF